MTDKQVSQGIKSWPKGDRPREKLLKNGVESLTNSELLAILLRTGMPGCSALDISRNILNKFGTFRNMAHTDSRDWKEFKGLGVAKIAIIQAALEIGRRFREDELRSEKQKISSAADIVDILIPSMRDLKKEVFKVIYLDNTNCIIEISDAAKGTVDHAYPIIREIIHTALQKFARSIICAHNHPSGNIVPSQEDIKLTENLRDAAKVMGIGFLDHIIIGGDKYYSFSEDGKI